jgi:hypothetical protein
MMTTILNLLLINVIMTLIHESGFIENIDEWISNKYKFHHLPYPVRCLLCGCWWISLFYVIITGQLSLLTVALCLINAHLTSVVRPLYRLVENLMLKVIELLNKWLNL